MKEDYSYFQDHEFRTSLAAYERMVANGEPVELNAETLTDIAEFYAMNQRDDEASRCIQYALSFYPDSIDPQIFLARQQMFWGNMSEAWKICNAIPDQDDREVMFLRAELSFRDTHDGKAFEPLYTVYQTMRDEKDEDAPDFMYDIISLCRDYNYLNKPLEWCNQLLEDYPQYYPAIALMAEIYNCKGQYQNAVDLLKSHLEDIAFDPDAWLQLGEAQMWLQNYTDALEATDYALAIHDEDAQALLLRANIYFDNNQSEKAHQYYVRFLHYYPTDGKAIYMNAQSLIDINRYQEANIQLEKLTNTPDTFIRGYAYSLLAYCHYKLGNTEKSLHFRKLAEKERFNNLPILFPDLYPTDEDNEEDSSKNFPGIDDGRIPPF